MSNTNKVFTVMSKEVTRLFSNQCVAGNTMNTQYDKTYENSGANAGSTLNIVQPQRYTVASGSTISIQDNIERSVSLPIATQKHVALNFTAAELTQDLLKPDLMAFFSKNKLKPAISALAAAIDSDVLNQAAQATYNAIGTPGSNPSAYSDITAARAELTKTGAQEDDRHYILTPASMASLNQGMSGLFNPTAEKSADYRSGHLKDTNGFTFWDTDFLARHLNGSGTTCAITATVPTEGASSINVDGCGAAGTYTVGTTLTIAGVYRKNLVSHDDKADLQKFVVTALATADGSGLATIKVSPSLEATGAYANVSAMPVEDAVVTLVGTASTAYDQNLAYQKEAFVFATAKMAKIGCEYESDFTDEDLGISIKYTSQGDVSALKNISRLDVLYGFSAVAPWWSVKQWGA